MPDQPTTKPSAQAAAGLATPRLASAVALGVFVLVFVFASLLVVAQAISTMGDSQAGVVTTDKTTVVAQPESSPVTTTEHTSEQTKSQLTWVDRVISPGVVFLIDLGIALVAAFVAAAATQRVLLGSYAFSLGPLSVPEIPGSEVSDPGDRAIEGIESTLPPEQLQGYAQAGAAVGTGSAHDATVSAAASPLLPASGMDPNLELVALRIEIERRVVRLATKVGLDTQNRSVQRLADQLVAGGLLPRDVADGLKDLVNSGNRAAHGAEVSIDAGTWAREEGPRLLAVLDALISQIGA